MPIHTTGGPRNGLDFEVGNRMTNHIESVFETLECNLLKEDVKLTLDLLGLVEKGKFFFFSSLGQQLINNLLKLSGASFQRHIRSPHRLILVGDEVNQNFLRNRFLLL